MTIDGIEIKLERKNIKNIHLTVYPPDGRVRCSVPFYLPEEKVISFLSSRLSWIKEKQKDLIEKSRIQIREFQTGEIHYLFGKPYNLEIISTKDVAKIELSEDKIQMWVFSHMHKAERAGFLFKFYQQQLKPKIEELMKKWLGIMREDIRPVEWSVETMRRQWGKCYPLRRRIVLNLMLARTPLVSLEYVIVHELVHLKIHGHGKDFKAEMNRFLPDWRHRKRLLNSFPSIL